MASSAHQISYCISALAVVPSSKLKRLQSIPNASARLIFGSPRCCTITPFLRDLAWLPVKSRIDHRLAILVFSCLHSRAPLYLTSELSRPTYHQRNLRSTNNGRVVQLLVRHPTLGGRLFAVTASQVWNSLPASLRTLGDLPLFKKQLKDYFFTCCFP